MTLRWQPLTWIDAQVMTARDRVAERWREDELPSSTGIAFPETHVYEESDLRSSSGRVRASYHVGPRITASTGVGLERFVRQLATYDTTPSSGPLLVGFSRLYVRSTSLSVDEHAAVGERVFITAALQRATNNFFATDAEKEWFPSANISWATPLRVHGVSGFRLRAAYAEAPGAILSPNFVLGVVPFTVSGSPFKMERTKSTEIGADATLGDAAHIDLTAFQSRSVRLWETSLTSGGTGYGVFGQNAEIRNSGLEALVSAPLLARRQFRWTGSLSLALLRNRVSGMMGTPPIDGVNGPYGRGYAFGGVWAQPYTYADANGDGIISPNELTFQPYRYVGPPLPTLESALSTDLQLGAGILVSTTFDYRAGNRVVDGTQALRCSAAANCRAVQDPSSSLADQAAALVGVFGTGFAEDASFMRVREIALHWAVPDRWSGLVGTRAELTLAGRNLAMWTRYRGLDPEISYQPASILPREDYMVMPLPRELIVRLDLATR